MKIYKCEICGNLVYLLEDGGGTLTCCDEPMTLLEAKEADMKLEKHVPVINVSGNHVTVTVGSTIHPMEEKHYITKIFVKYNNKVVTFDLHPNEKPVVEFDILEEFNKLEVYEYCNLHGLWKSEYNK